LRAFDRASGELRMSWGLGGCSLIGATGDGVVVRTADRSLIGFARGAQPAPIAQVMVRGSVTDGCEPLAFEPVRVGDALVATDLSGHYTAITSARGSLRVEAGPIGELTLVRDLVGSGGVQVVDLRSFQDVPYQRRLQVCGYGGCELYQVPVTCSRGRR
jgi:hypothetical protein